MINAIELTKEQIDVLRSSGTSEKRLETGNLYPVEYKILLAYEEVCKYLPIRYPDEIFVFHGIDNSFSSSGGFTFFYAPQDKPDELFSVKTLLPNKQFDQWQIKDSYYNNIKHDELNVLVQQTMIRHGLQAMCNLQINGWYDTSYPHTEQLEKTLNVEHTADISGWVYVNGNGTLDEYVMKLQNDLRIQGLCGGFRLMLVSVPTTELVLRHGRPDSALIVEEMYLPLSANEERVY